MLFLLMRCWRNIYGQKDAFVGRGTELDDLNITPDQSERLYFAIKGGLKYPKINIYGYVDNNELMAFLEKLNEIFNWEKYARALVGGEKNGEHPVLKKNAVALSKWFKGMTIQQMIKDSIAYKKLSGQKVYFSNHTTETYDGSARHNNQIAADVLNDINDVILFSFANYFMAFSFAYKAYFDEESFSK